VHYLDEIVDLGGASCAINFMQKEIANAAYIHQRNIEDGKRVVVGVNQFVDEEEKMLFGQGSDFLVFEGNQRDSLNQIKAKRDEKQVVEVSRQISSVVRSGDNLMPILIRAVKTDVTLGEISSLFRKEWGEYQA